MGEEVTCRIERDGKLLYESTKSGIAPLAEILENCVDVVGGTAYDKIVGKAAAFLYSLMKVGKICAGVMSKTAVEILKAEGIAFAYDTLTDSIINRRGDGLCPMEQTVLNIDDKNQAYVAIKSKLAGLR